MWQGGDSIHLATLNLTSLKENKMDLDLLEHIDDGSFEHYEIDDLYCD